MSDLYDKINGDLKQAMISKDSDKVSVLKMVKSAVLYAAVDSGSRDNISDEQVSNILRKESKKRDEASLLYAKAGDVAREEAEKYEKQVIDQYLPPMLGEEEVVKMVDKFIEKLDQPDIKSLGKIIAEVKAESKGLADGGLVARIAKEKLSK